MRNIRAHAILVIATALVALTAEAASKSITLELKPPKKPVVAAPVMESLFTAGPIALVVLDARGADDPAIVGGQRIKGEEVYSWRATQPVAPKVAEFVTQVLSGWAVRVAPDAETTLRLGLMKYYVNERSDTFGSTYLGEVRFMVSVTDRAGAVLWTGEASGQSKRPGVDARASMGNEALSDALVRALAQALASVKLESGAPAAAPAAAAAAAPPVAAPPEPVPAVRIVIAPDALLADLSRLNAGGVGEDVLVAYVEQRKLSRPLTVDEILDWKNAGMPDAVIKAATRP